MSLTERARALDERYTSSGPLAILREVPQLLLMLSALVFFVGSGVVLANSDDESETGGGVSLPDVSVPRGQSTLGPTVGESVLGYYDDVNRALATLAEREPDSSVTALVSLGTSVTSAQARALTAGLQVQRVYLRAGEALRPETVPVEITDLGPDLRRVYGELVRRKTIEVRQAQEFAAGINPATLPADRAAADDDVRVIARERLAYAQGCPCVMAMVVSSTPPLLLDLLEEQAVVTAIEVARTNAPLDGLTIRPLPPQATVTGVVTELPPAPMFG